MAPRFLAGRCPSAEIEDEAVAEAYARRYPSAEVEWIQLRHIFRRLPREASREERDRAAEELAGLRALAAGGHDFAALAMEHSDSETAAEGGLIGRLSRQAPIDRRILAVAWSLPDGGLSAPIEVTDGVHLLWREASGSQPRPPLEQVRAEIEQALRQAQRASCVSHVLQELARRTPVVPMLDDLPLDPPPDRVLLEIGDEPLTVEALSRVGWRSGVQAVLEVANTRLLSTAILEEGGELADALRERRRQAMEELLRQEQLRLERLRWAERSEDELHALFERSPQRFQTELRLDLAVIVLAPAKGETGRRALLDRAWELRRQLDRGAHFEERARAVSVHRSRQSGGRLGVLPASRIEEILGAQVAAAVLGLDSGELSDPVLLTVGSTPLVVLAKVYDRTEPLPRSFADARAEVIEALVRDGGVGRDRALRSAVLQAAGFAVDGRAVDAFLASLAG